jgi:hypothetical protein
VVGLLDELTSQRDELASQRDELAAKVAQRDIENARLRRLLYGRKSEKLSAEELGQLLLALGATEAESSQPNPDLPIPELDDTEPGEQPDPADKKKRRNHHGRGKLSPDLRRIVTEVPAREDECQCTECGREMTVFGHIEHERVEYVPAELVVRVERREKRGCRHCKASAVTAERKDDRDTFLRAGASLLAHLMESHV